jgi:tetratricopeptide (TPR) repeat protein
MFCAALDRTDRRVCLCSAAMRDYSTGIAVRARLLRARLELKFQRVRSRVVARLTSGVVAAGNSAVSKGQADQAESLYRWAVAVASFAPADAVRAHSRSFALAQLGNFLRLRGRYAEADQVPDGGLGEAEATLGPDDPCLVPLLNALGIVCKYTGEFDRAERVYRRALSLVEAQDPTNLGQKADLYHNLGGLEHARGRHAAGEPLARRAVELRQLDAGTEHLTVAADRAALAAILDALGRSEEAEALLIPAVSAFEATTRHERADLAAALNNLAAIHHRRGAVNEAEHLYRRALVIKEQLHGAEHPDLAPTLNNLATLLRERGETDEAIRLYKRALAVIEPSVEPDHPNLLACRANYSALLQRTGSRR